jgi:hypothetical protein
LPPSLSRSDDDLDEKAEPRADALCMVLRRLDWGRRRRGLFQQNQPIPEFTSMSAFGAGCVETRGRSIAIEQVNRSRPFRGAASFDFEVELKNIILVALQDFEFSHGLGVQQTS